MAAARGQRDQQRAKAKETPLAKVPVAAPNADDHCLYCTKDLRTAEKALFVEEEIGRVFCSEDCITHYFSPEIQRMEKEYFRMLTPSDLSDSEREKLSHLRWVTLEEPDEVWREKTVSGDQRFTLISQFQPAGAKPVWCVCICLFLRGEPSFLYLAFPTRNAAMANHYRRGERVQWSRGEAKKKGAPNQGFVTSVGQAQPAASKKSSAQSSQQSQSMAQQQQPMPPSKQHDGLADEWTEEETMRAQLTHSGRRTDDIPAEDYALYEGCLDETLEQPNEVWAMKTAAAEGEDAETADEKRLFHFIRHYPGETPAMWYVVVARETDDEEEIELLDAFPTRDAELVDRYRKGSQEVGAAEANVPSRMVH